jgi:hypothetical protein
MYPNTRANLERQNTPDQSSNKDHYQVGIIAGIMNYFRVKLTIPFPFEKIVGKIR